MSAKSMTQPVSCRRGPDVHLDAERVAVQPRALVVRGTLGSRCAASNVNSLKISMRLPSRNPEELVGLQAQPPARMREAVRHGQLRCCARVGPSMAEGRSARRRGARSARVGARLGNTSLSSCPARSTSSAPAFGLTQIQSMPGGGSSVPLVSTATSKPARGVPRSSGVELQERLAAGADDKSRTPRQPLAGHAGATAAASNRPA